MSGTPSRCARAPALGPSLSQIATSCAPRILDSTGRCASCAIAPAPTSPSRMSRVTPAPARFGRYESRISFVDAAHGRTLIIGGENGPEILPCSRAADRAPLTHPYCVAPSAATECEARNRARAASAARLGGEICAVEKSAARRAKDEAHVVTAYHV